MAFRKFLSRFSMFDLVVIAMMASLGVAIKPVVVPLAHIITGPLYIPGGVIAGGFYMMWIVLGAGLVGKLGTAPLISSVQAIMVISIGVLGTHGIMSLMTYILPGLPLTWCYLYPAPGLLPGMLFCFGIGQYCRYILVNLVFFRLPLVPVSASAQLCPVD